MYDLSTHAFREPLRGMLVDARTTTDGKQSTGARRASSGGREGSAKRHVKDTAISQRSLHNNSLLTVQQALDRRAAPLLPLHLPLPPLPANVPQLPRYIFPPYQDLPHLRRPHIFLPQGEPPTLQEQ